MTDVFFSDEIKCENETLIIELDKSSVGNRIMVVYTDIFGNDLTESFSL
jgi:site-specific DNA-methyltransferase (adenine-specific)/adenine-specific DNA-methyltransferase